MGKRIMTRRRGAGSMAYTTPSHKHKGEVHYPYMVKGTGRVLDLIHDPGHTSPIAVIEWDGGEVVHLPAAEGLYVEQTVEMGSEAPAQTGNILPIGRVPEGTNVFNIELQPGDGGRIIRAAGASALVISQGKYTTVQLPSGQLKNIDPRSKATVGIVAGGGRGEKPFGKAGKVYYAMAAHSKVWPKVLGVCMNPIDHPHGGGGHKHIGKPSTVGRGAPPGRKVGRLSPKKKKAGKI